MDEKQAPEKTQWYALRSMRRSILGCKSILTDLHIEHFIPMVKIKTRTPSGRFRWNEQPLAFNYVFVHSTAAALNDLKQTRLSNLCYLMRPNEKGFDAKVIVPDEQMRNFIAIAGTSEERILYLPGSGFSSWRPRTHNRGHIRGGGGHLPKNQRCTRQAGRSLYRRSRGCCYCYRSRLFGRKNITCKRDPPEYESRKTEEPSSVSV